MRVRGIQILILLLLISTFSGAGNDSPPSLDRDSWQEMRKEIDYSEERPRERKNIQFNSPPKVDISWMRILVYILIAGILLYLLYRIITWTLESNGPVKRNRFRVSSIGQAEENLRSADLDHLLNQLLEKGNYREALRVQYLKVLQELDQGGFIRWKKHKTNGDYLFELKERPFFDSFKVSTLEFEEHWYGEIPVDKRLYLNLEPMFNDLHQELQIHG